MAMRDSTRRRVSMLRFYAGLFWDLPRAIWEASDLAWRVAELALILAIVLPPVSIVLKDVNDWLAIITPAALLFLILIGLARANYDRFGRLDVHRQFLQEQLEIRGSERGAELARALHKTRERAGRVIMSLRSPQNVKILAQEYVDASAALSVEAGVEGGKVAVALLDFVLFVSKRIAALENGDTDAERMKLLAEISFEANKASEEVRQLLVDAPAAPIPQST